jgi:hypothetical protein
MKKIGHATSAPKIPKTKKIKPKNKKKNLKQKQLQHKVFVDDCTTKKRK